MKKSKIITAIIAIVLGALSLNFIPTSTHAVDICAQDGVSDEVKKANGCYGNASTDLSTVIVNIVNGIVGALGLVAVIFIVVGGVNYMTSQGDPGKTKKAKDTILYASIGLIIAVLAFAIVNFVIGNIINNSGNNNSNNSSSNSSSNVIKGGGPN
ncbi:MAG: pilin [Candidatus Saccharibacteria bacterium]|nr:pilin [Candidatus Saccharibacteria bacterium]